jgi:hypothetical protein
MSRIDDLPPLREVIRRHELSARKSLGQNFLLDLNLTARIARAGGALDGVTVIEIGPAGHAVVLRPGGVGREELEAVLGGPLGERRSVGPVTAPGQLDSHYAPRTPVLLEPRPWSTPPRGRFGVLLFGGTVPAGAAAVEVLGTDPVEAARHLFGALRELDEAGLDAIVAETFPSEEGLGYAINDRLRRAAAR